MGDSTSTINRGGSSRTTNNRLGLLLKQYYDDGGEGRPTSAFSTDFSLARLEKLSTEPLMSKAVESLRFYKEAESDLRMLLYNNCDKLLEAVEVVCAIRDGSTGLCQQALSLQDGADKVNAGIVLETSAGKKYVESLKKYSLLRGLEQLERLGKWLREGTSAPVESKLRMYLKLCDDLFNNTTASSGVFIREVAREAREIVDFDLVPILLNAGSRKITCLAAEKQKTRLGLLLDLYPKGHEKRREVLEQFVELEMSGFDDQISITKTAEDSLNLFSAVLNTLFLAHELEISDVEEKIRDDLVVRASRNIALKSGNLNNSEQFCDFLETALAAHARIPNVSRSGINHFVKTAMVSWIEAKFFEAAKIFLSEDFPTCDAVHTRCCTALAAIHECVISAGSMTSDDFINEILTAMKVYYERVTLPAAPGEEDVAEHLFKLLKMNKMLQNRKTVQRSLNALREIFTVDQEELGEKKMEMVIPGNIFRIIKLLGQCPRTIRELNAIIEKISTVLDPGSLTATASRFNAATVVDEENHLEMIHSRKLMFSCNGGSHVSLEMAASVVVCMFLKSNVAEVDDRVKWKESVVEIASKHVGPSGDPELMKPIFAMLKDM